MRVSISRPPGYEPGTLPLRQPAVSTHCAANSFTSCSGRIDPKGIEPLTCRLLDGCSTTELWVCMPESAGSTLDELHMPESAGSTRNPPGGIEPSLPGPQPSVLTVRRRRDVCLRARAARLGQSPILAGKESNNRLPHARRSPIELPAISLREDSNLRPLGLRPSALPD